MGVRGWHGACNSPAAAHRCTYTHQGYERIIMKTTIAAAFAALLALTAGCNTIEGAGKDVKATGQAVENAADKAKPN
jgi:predicted small secreted protein